MVSVDGLDPDKFTVTRNDGQDGPGGRKEGARYFVLCYSHDRNARGALAFYAGLVEDKFPQLAADILRELEETEPQ